MGRAGRFHQRIRPRGYGLRVAGVLCALALVPAALLPLTPTALAEEGAWVVGGAGQSKPVRTGLFPVAEFPTPPAADQADAGDRGLVSGFSARDALDGFAQSAPAAPVVLDDGTELTLGGGAFSVSAPLSARDRVSVSAGGPLRLGAPGHGAGLADAAVDPTALTNPYAGFGAAGASAGVSHDLGDRGSVGVTTFNGDAAGSEGGQNFGAVGEYTVGLGSTDIAVSFGTVRETDTVLGDADAAAPADDAVTTGFAGLRFSTRLTDRVALFGSVYQGVTGAGDQAGEIGGPVRSESYSVGLAGNRLLTGGDRIGFVISQPLRLSAPAPGEDGVDPSAFDREIRLQAFYNTPLGDVASFGVGGIYRLNPDHDAEAQDDASALIRFNFKF